MTNASWCGSAAANKTTGVCVECRRLLITNAVKSHNVDPRATGKFLWDIEITWEQINWTLLKPYITIINKGVWNQTPLKTYKQAKNSWWLVASEVLERKQSNNMYILHQQVFRCSVICTDFPVPTWSVLADDHQQPHCLLQLKASVVSLRFSIFFMSL